LRIGVIGAGGMGANHARVIAESEVADLAMVVDRDTDRAADLARQFGAPVVVDPSEVARHCDAVVVATSTPTHLDVALPLLEGGMPLLIEKPLAETAADAEKLIDASARAGVPLMCGFVERFNPALVTALSLIDEPVVNLHAMRHSPHNPYVSASVVQDLLIHDIDLALRANGGTVLPDVRGTNWTPPNNSGRSEVVECVLKFESQMVANLSASRWGQRKIREVRIVTDHRLVEVDLLRVNVSVYRNISQSIVDGGGPYRAETVMDVPYVRHRGEPLALQLSAFVDLVREGDATTIDAERASIMPPHIVAATMEGL
jgi:predicted dehydrogenase